MVDEFSGLDDETLGGATVVAAQAAAEYSETLTRLFGDTALSNADVFFAHITSENDTLYPWNNGNWTEGEYDYLSVLSDHPTFKENLFIAIQRPDFASLLSGDGGSDLDLEALIATPGGQDAIVDIVAQIASDDFNGDYAALTSSVAAQVMVAGMADFREELRGMEPAERFTALRDRIESLDGTGNIETGDLVTALNDVDPGIQEALGNAFAYNDQFAAYVIERMAPAEGAGAEATTDLASLLQNMPANAAGPVAGLLNVIAQDPEYDVEGRLDPLITAVSTHTRLTTELAAIPEEDAAARAAKNEEIEAANRAMLGALRDAGGNVPALAGMNSTMMMAFMMDLVNGTGTDGAIANLGEALNLTPEQLEAMQELIGPFAGLIEFMVEPYAELYQEHGVAIMDAFGRTQDRVEILTGTTQPEFDEEAAEAAREAAAAEVTVSFEQPATVGTVTAVNFGDDFTEAMEGRSYADMEDVLDAMVEANTNFTDEAELLREAVENGIITDVELRETFGMSAAGAPPADAAVVEAGVETLHERLRGGQSLQASLGM